MTPPPPIPTHSSEYCGTVNRGLRTNDSPHPLQSLHTLVNTVGLLTEDYEPMTPPPLQSLHTLVNTVGLLTED